MSAAEKRFTDVEQLFLQRIARSLDSEALREFDEWNRLSLVKSMRKIGMDEYPQATGNPHGQIEECGCLCPVCAKPNIDHPMDWRVIGYGNVPFLNVLCDGRWVKL